MNKRCNMMNLLLITDKRRVQIWLEALNSRLPDLSVRVWPDVGSKEDIDFVLCWDADPQLLSSLPNLRAIFSLGAGVDHILRSKAVPQHVPIVRMIDSSLTNAVTQYALLAVLRHHRNIETYKKQQESRIWKKIGLSNLVMPRVGVLGLGTIGSQISLMLSRLGYPTSGWSRHPKQLKGVTNCVGLEGFDDILSTSDILVSILPKTSQTENILDADAFSRMPHGAYLVNVGRGEHVVDQDLLGALDSGQLSGATLDVFRVEPLPDDHPFWIHPKIMVTPHDGGDTIPGTAALGIAANIKRILNGQQPCGIVDRQDGY